MRKLRTLFVTLVVLCLVPCSLMASSGMWGWVTSSQSSETLTVPEETLIEETKISEMDLTSLEVISDVVAEDDESDEMVLIPRKVLNAVVGKFESGMGFTAKAKASVEEAKADLEDSATVYVAPAPAPAAPKFQHFMTMDAEHGFGADLKIGVSYGFIFKNCLIAQMGVMKNATFNNWMDKTEYTGRVSLGIVF